MQSPQNTISILAPGLICTNKPDLSKVFTQIVNFQSIAPFI